ncbi:MAG: hypothetical protein ABR587_15020, partial [Candidatus Binatia bacterium]
MISRFLAGAAAALLAVSTPTSAEADPARCRTTIVKSSAAYVQKRAAALAGCEGRVLAGKL